MVKGKTVMIICWPSGSEGQDYYDTISKKVMDAGAKKTIPSIHRPTTQAEADQFMRDYESADATAISGGQQDHLNEPIVNYPEIATAFKNHFYVKFDPFITTSASAMYMATTVLNGSTLDSLPGLGFYPDPDTAIDTHFHDPNKVPREPRLRAFMAKIKAKFGIGLGHNTGLLVKDGKLGTIFGPGTVEFYQAVTDGPATKQSYGAGTEFSIHDFKPISICSALGTQSTASVK